MIIFLKIHFYHFLSKNFNGFSLSKIFFSFSISFCICNKVLSNSDNFLSISDEDKGGDTNKSPSNFKEIGDKGGGIWRFKRIR